MVRPSNLLARPNYFISIPLSQPQHAELGRRARSLTDRIPKSPGLLIIPPPRLHLTLGVCALHEKPQVDLALSILDSCKPRLAEILDKRQLWVQFSDIGTFPSVASRARVVYAVPLDIPQTPNLLKDVTEYVHSKFSGAGLLVGKRSFRLHCTLAKIDYRAQGGPKSMDVEALFSSAHLSAHSLGSYPLSRIELCGMGTINAEGNYRSEGGLDLS